VETKRIIQRVNETMSWFLEKINNIEKSLAKLNGERERERERERTRTQMNKIRDAIGDTNEIQRIIREYLEKNCIPMS
jgi:hypothetical protein